MSSIPLDTPLSELSHVPARFLTHLSRMGIRTVRELLSHFPARYEDFSSFRPIADLETGEQVTIQAQVEEVSSRQSWRRRFMIVEASLADGSGTIRAVWFNQPYVAQQLKRSASYNFSGKVSLNEEGELYLSNPSFEVLPHGSSEESESYLSPITSHLQPASLKHTGRLVPVYPETKGLTSKGLRFLIHPLLEHIEPLHEFIPEAILEKESLPELNDALRTIHFPHTLEEAERAKRRFSFEDLFLLQLSNLRERLALQKQAAPPIPASIERIQEFLATLPFPLTASQKKALWEILQNIGEAHPMNRLLQGDVGSGKTVIAAIAAFLAAEAGLQIAVMAPTEILARQHYATFKQLTGKVKPSSGEGLTFPTLGLLTAHESRLMTDTGEVTLTKKKLKDAIGRGTVSIVVGTHALLGDTITWNNLGLVVIDEQHRFGVRQRATLTQKKGAILPHFLSMSATPIPRTLTLTVFGDLDLSTITELPPGRKAIKTYVVPPEKRPGAYQFIRKHVKEGRQVFVICPRIEPPQEEKENTSPRKFNSAQLTLWDVRTVREEYEKLSKKVFPDLRVGMLHGKMPAQEKGAIMAAFKNGSLDILVSTSVIEVGVDIPNATIMLIEGADRFGLAQLYQLRGRVGRGAHESFCLLFTDSSSKSTAARLQAITKAKNGFELAEYDLKQRGPGEFLGQSQTGFPDSAMEALMDPPLISASREAAKEILRIDPELAQHPMLKEKLAEFERAIHLE